MYGYDPYSEIYRNDDGAFVLVFNDPAVVRKHKLEHWDRNKESNRAWLALNMNAEALAGFPAFQFGGRGERGDEDRELEPLGRVLGLGIQANVPQERGRQVVRGKAIACGTCCLGVGLTDRLARSDVHLTTVELHLELAGEDQRVLVELRRLGSRL